MNGLSMNDVSAGNAILERPSRARRAWRAFIRYVVAIGVGVAATLAWQSYGETTKQIIAMRAPQFGWSPDAQRKIVAFMDELGWAKPPAPSNSAIGPAAQGASQAASLAHTTSERAVPTPETPSIELEQIRVMAKGLITLQQTVDTLAAHQDQMAHEIDRLQAANQEILDKVSAPSPQAAAATPPRRTPLASPPSRAPMTPH
jgi:hypothetical protein